MLRITDVHIEVYDDSRKRVTCILEDILSHHIYERNFSLFEYNADELSYIYKHLRPLVNKLPIFANISDFMHVVIELVKESHRKKRRL